MNLPDLYSKYNGLPRSDAEYILKKYFHLVRWNDDKYENVLDVGCGDGSVTADMLYPLLPENIWKLVAADISPEMLNYAKTDHHKSKVFYTLLDIGTKQLDLNFREEFGHIFSFYCLHWIQDQRQCAINLHKILIPGGDIFVIFLAKHPAFQVYEILSKYKQWAEYMLGVERSVTPYQHSEDPAEEYRNLLTKSGFDVDLCKVVNRSYTYLNLSIWKKSVTAVHPIIARIPNDLKEGYFTDFFNELKKLQCGILNKNNEETVRYQYQILVAHATKIL